MTTVLGDLSQKYAKVYLDDNIIHSYNIKQHLAHLYLVLQCLCEYSYVLNYINISFCRNELASLGMILMPMVFTLPVKRFLMYRSGLLLLVCPLASSAWSIN